MTVTNGVSFIGQSQSQANRLMTLKSTVDDLQRQMTTQKKYDTLSGFGLDSGNVLQLHASSGHTQSYLDNIESLSSRAEISTRMLTQASEIANNLASVIHTQISAVPMDMGLIHQAAQQGFDFLTDIMNTNLEGRYIFGGTNTQTAPYADKNSIQLSMQTQITNWLNGTNTTAQLLTNVDAYSSTNLGFDPSLTSAGDVNMRVDNNMDINYGAIADKSGMKDILRSLVFALEITEPNPATDIPTRAEFETAMTKISTTARKGVTQIQQTIGMIDSKLELAKSLKSQHEQDLALFQKMTDSKENADSTAVITQLQALQTQMSAAYQVTHIVSQLSLVNFLN